MKPYEVNFNQEFMDIVIQQINSKGLTSVYNIKKDGKYTVNRMIDVVCAISNKTYQRYKLPAALANYLKQSQFARFSKTILKNLIISQQIEATGDNSFFNTYVVIGHDVPIAINELNVVLD
jgi:hypothetical protein